MKRIRKVFSEEMQRRVTKNKSQKYHVLYFSHVRHFYNKITKKIKVSETRF